MHTWCDRRARLPVDCDLLQMQYVCMNSDTLKTMMCTMTPGGESWES